MEVKLLRNRRPGRHYPNTRLIATQRVIYGPGNRGSFDSVGPSATRGQHGIENVRRNG